MIVQVIRHVLQAYLMVRAPPCIVTSTSASPATEGTCQSQFRFSFRMHGPLMGEEVLTIHGQRIRGCSK